MMFDKTKRSYSLTNILILIQFFHSSTLDSCCSYSCMDTIDITQKSQGAKGYAQVLMNGSSQNTPTAHVHHFHHHVPPGTPFPSMYGYDPSMTVSMMSHPLPSPPPQQPLKSVVKTPITALGASGPIIASAVVDRKTAMSAVVPILQFTSKTGIAPVVTSTASGPLILASSKPSATPAPISRSAISMPFVVKGQEAKDKDKDKTLPADFSIASVLKSPPSAPYESEPFKMMKQTRQRQKAYLTQTDVVSGFVRTLTLSRPKLTPIDLMRTPSQSTRTPIYVWFDAEMTQFHDPRVDELLEIAFVLTDDAFFEYERCTIVFKHKMEDIQGKLSAITRSMHTESGLLDEVQHATLTYAEGEQIAMNKLKQVATRAPFGERWTKQYFLSGTTIHTDLKFLQQKMPRFAEMLHHSLYDMNAFIKAARGGMFGPLYLPHLEPTHRAIFDVEDSLYTMRLIREYNLLKCNQ